MGNDSLKTNLKQTQHSRPTLDQEPKKKRNLKSTKLHLFVEQAVLAEDRTKSHFSKSRICIFYQFFSSLLTVLCRNSHGRHLTDSVQLLSIFGVLTCVSLVMLQHVDFLCKFSVTFLALVFLNPFVKLHVVTKGVFCLHSCETGGTGHLAHHSHLQGRTQAHAANQQLYFISAASPQLHIFHCLCSNAHYQYYFNSRKKLW